MQRFSEYIDSRLRGVKMARQPPISLILPGGAGVMMSLLALRYDRLPPHFIHTGTATFYIARLPRRHYFPGRFSIYFFRCRLLSTAGYARKMLHP